MLPAAPVPYWGPYGRLIYPPGTELGLGNLELQRQAFVEGFFQRCMEDKGYRLVKEGSAAK